MRLATRLVAGGAALTLGAVASFGTLAYGGFVRQQDASLRRLLAEDLARTAALLDRPVLGATLVNPEVDGSAVQVVAADGATLLAWGAPAPLPLETSPAVHALDGRRVLVGSAPWRGEGATLRVAHDVEGALATRAALARTLWVGAAATFLLAVGLAALAARRATRSLERVAAAARRVDPAAPEVLAYTGGGDEVRALTDALNGTLVAIRERTRRERAFLLEVAHELSGPLTLVHYHLAAARRGRADDPALRAAAEAAEELLRTSQDLLLVARGEDERPLEQGVLALREVLERVVRAYPGVALAASDPGEAVGDADRLTQAFRNLVRNAVQAAGRPEGVRVALDVRGDELVVRVADDGPGLDFEARRRVFERGFRRGEGSGVGLAIAKELIERHGGTVRALDEPGPGAVFEVRLPSLAARLAATDDGARGAAATP